VTLPARRCSCRYMSISAAGALAAAKQLHVAAAIETDTVPLHRRSPLEACSGSGTGLADSSAKRYLQNLDFVYTLRVVNRTVAVECLINFN